MGAVCLAVNYVMERKTVYMVWMNIPVKQWEALYFPMAVLLTISFQMHKMHQMSKLTGFFLKPH